MLCSFGYITHTYVAIQVCKTGRAPQAHFPLHQAGSPRAVVKESPRLGTSTMRPGPCSHVLFPLLNSPTEILLSTVIPKQITLPFHCSNPKDIQILCTNIGRNLTEKTLLTDPLHSPDANLCPSFPSLPLQRAV